MVLTGLAGYLGLVAGVGVVEIAARIMADAAARGPPCSASPSWICCGPRSPPGC
jgi:hypothetical protein